jgi:hypothetical protein
MGYDFEFREIYNGCNRWLDDVGIELLYDRE